MNKIIYLCQHCKSSHKFKEEIEMCQIQSKEEPSVDEIYRYVELQGELTVKKALRGAFQDLENNPTSSS